MGEKPKRTPYPLHRIPFAVRGLRTHPTSSPRDTNCVPASPLTEPKPRNRRGPLGLYWNPLTESGKDEGKGVYLAPPLLSSLKCPQTRPQFEGHCATERIRESFTTCNPATPFSHPPSSSPDPVRDLPYTESLSRTKVKTRHKPQPSLRTSPPGLLRRCGPWYASDR